MKLADPACTWLTKGKPSWYIAINRYYTSIFGLLVLTSVIEPFVFVVCVLIVWLWNSSRVLGHGCFAIPWWNWSFDHRCSAHYSVGSSISFTSSCTFFMLLEFLIHSDCYNDLKLNLELPWNLRSNHILCRVWAHAQSLSFKRRGSFFWIELSCSEFIE